MFERECEKGEKVVTNQIKLNKIEIEINLTKPDLFKTSLSMNMSFSFLLFQSQTSLTWLFFHYLISIL